MSSDANRLIYLNGQPVPVTEAVYLEWYRPIWRCHDFARRHGQCSLSRWQLCEGDCGICRFRMAGDHSSLDDLHDSYLQQLVPLPRPSHQQHLRQRLPFLSWKQQLRQGGD